MELSNTSQTRARPFFVTVMAELLLSVLGAATGILVARLLGPAGRGELAAITLWPATILTLGGLGVPHSTAYFVAARSKELGKIYINSLILAVFQCLLLIPIGFLVIPVVLKREFANVIPLSLVYLVSIPLSLTAGIHMGILQGLLWMGRHSLQRLVSTGFYLMGLLVFFIYGEAGLGSMVGLLLSSLAISTLLGLWPIRKKVTPLSSPDLKLLREMLGYGLKTQVSQSAYVLNLRLDQLILSMFLPPQGLGYYAVAVTFSGIMNPFNQAVGTVTLPDIASRDKKDDQARRILTILRLNFMVMLILAIGLIAVTPWVLPLLFGTKFMPATIPAQILIVGAFILGMNHISTQALLGLNKPIVPAVAQAVSLGVMAILLYMLLPRYGIIGAAIASVITYGVTFAVLWFHLAGRSGLNLRVLLPKTSEWRAILNSLVDFVKITGLRDYTLPIRGKEGRMSLSAKIQDLYDSLLVASYPTNGVKVPPRVLRNYVNLTGYEYANTIRRFVGKSQRILIIGDAGGRDYYFLKMAGKEVYVLDIAPQALPHFILGDVTKPLPFRDQIFDAVVMAEVIEHLVEDYEALKEVARVLKGDGVLVLTVPFYHDAPEWHVRIHSPQTIRRLLEASGYRITEYVEKGGGCTLLERWRMYNYTVHALNLLAFIFTRRTFYQSLNNLLMKIDLILGNRRNSLWHRWSYLYGAFIKCQKASPRDFRALNREAFAGKTPAVTRQLALAGHNENEDPCHWTDIS